LTSPSGAYNSLSTLFSTTSFISTPIIHQLELIYSHTTNVCSTVMIYATSTPTNAPRKYNTIETDAPDHLSGILSPYSTKSNGSWSVCLPSITLLHARNPGSHGSIAPPFFFSVIFPSSSRRNSQVLLYPNARRLLSRTRVHLSRPWR
jgi:hypothetical protein